MAEQTDLKPGPELDALIAEKVMEYQCYRAMPCPVHDFHPSTDITHAWEVVEKMTEQGYTVVVWGMPYGKSAKCDMANAQMAFVNMTDKPTVPHAICLAALKAVEG